MSVSIIEQIETLFEHQGHEAYLGENISIANHMLQCAWLADKAGEPDEVIAAALLHDIGHLLSKQTNLKHLADEDLYHQHSGAAFLAPYFPTSVVNAVQHHVSAKRYLCAADSDYFGQLSDASVHTLQLQGGAMSEEEACAFEQLPDLEQILRVRIYDDQGKNNNLQPPEFSYYRSILKSITPQ